MMKMEKLRIFALLISAAMGLGLLAGCDGNAGTNAGEGVPAPGGNSELRPEPSGDAPSDILADGSSDAVNLEYYEREDIYTDLTFSVEPGIYTDSITIQVLGADGADIYYTVNGYDPLVYDDEVRLDGEVLDESGFQLTDGAINLKIRAVNPGTLEVGPLYSVNYTVKIPFDTTSDAVDQDSYYDYFIDRGWLNRLDIWTGEWEPISNGNKGSVYGLCVINELTTLAEHYGEDYGSSFIMPESYLQWEEHKDDLIERSMVTFRLERTKEMVYSFSVGGELENWEYTGERSDAHHVGNGAWFVENGRVYWSDDMQEPVATEETVLWCQLLTDEIALRAENVDGIWSLLARDPNGENERILFTSETEIYLDAIVRQRVLYHVGEGDDTVHMVYELDSGDIHENINLEKGDEILGYTTRNIYRNGEIISYDYESLSETER